MNISLKRTCNEFHKEILEKAPSINNAKAWSKVIFSVLAEMAVNHNLCCWTSKRYIPNQLLRKIEELNGSEPFEFMVDMCWTTVDWRNEYEKRIEVAIECEWGQSLGELEWDFAKLLHINAPRKIFIFESGIKNQKIREDNLVSMLSNYDHKRFFYGDQMLLININNNEIKYTCFEIRTSKQLKGKFCLMRKW